MADNEYHRKWVERMKEHARKKADYLGVKFDPDIMKIGDVENPYSSDKLPKSQDPNKMTTGQKISTGVNLTATAANIGLAAYGANRDAKQEAKERKEQAVVEGLHSVSNAAGNRAMMEQNALHALMRVGR